MNKIFGTILLVAIVGNCFSQEFELLEVEYARYPNAALNHIDSIEAIISEYQVSFLFHFNLQFFKIAIEYGENKSESITHEY